MSDVPTRTDAGGSTMGKGCIIALVAIGLATVLSCCGGGFILSGLFHSGEEFSPQTWERRTYAYGAIPLIEYQVTGLQRTPAPRTSFETYLIGQKLVPLHAQANRWDVTYAIEPMPTSYRDAAILTIAIDEIGPAGGFVWQDWSIAHPELARLLWPCIATLAEDYLYVYVPDLLELAREAEDPTAFEKTLTEKMTTIYSELADDERAAGRTAVADRLDDRAALFAKTDWRKILFQDAIEPPAALVDQSNDVTKNGPTTPPGVATASASAGGTESPEKTDDEEQDNEKPGDQKSSDGAKDETKEDAEKQDDGEDAPPADDEKSGESSGDAADESDDAP